MKTCLYLILFAVAVASSEVSGNHSEAYLIFSTWQEIRTLSLDGLKSTILRSADDCVGVDYQFGTGNVFSSEHETDIMRSIGQDSYIVIQGTTEEWPQNIAFDWIYHNLYWVDNKKNTLEVANFNGTKRKVLIKDNIERPIGIVVVPMEGWMFWTNTGKLPRIAKAGMDGSAIEVILSENLVAPVSITADFARKQLYWNDMGLRQISSCDYNGENSRQIVHSGETLSWPFGIAIFENWLYWSCRATRSMYKYDVLGGNVTRLFKADHDGHPPIGMNIYHKTKQPHGENHCENAGCSHWCLPAPKWDSSSATFTCICPKKLILFSDGVTCILAGEEHMAKRLNEIEFNDEEINEEVEEVYRDYDNIHRSLADLYNKIDDLYHRNAELSQKCDRQCGELNLLKLLN